MELKKNVNVSDNGFVFDANSGDTFTLNETGVFILKLLQEHRSEPQIVELLSSEFEVDALTAERNTMDFVAMLKKNNLIAL